MKHDFKQLLPLFLTFAKIGAFTFGGGYAMLPLIQEQVLASSPPRPSNKKPFKTAAHPGSGFLSHLTNICILIIIVLSDLRRQFL